MNLNTTKTQSNQNNRSDYAPDYAALQQLVRCSVIFRWSKSGC